MVNISIISHRCHQPLLLTTIAAAAAAARPCQDMEIEQIVGAFGGCLVMVSSFPNAGRGSLTFSLPLLFM